MDSIIIENLSVGAVETSITLSEYLFPYINSNDRGPSFDGYINIYSKKGHKKENLMGSVNVQIKGKKNKDLSKEEISYPIKMVDLNNFLNRNGVIFFVVYITDSLETQIYYCSLLPIRLRRLIREAAGQKTKSVRLKKFPMDNDRKREIFVNFFNNSQRQASFTKVTLPTIEDLKASGELIDLKVFISKVGEKDHRTVYIDNEIYVYAEIKGSDAPQPLDILPEEIKKTIIHKASIKINGTEWYSEYSIVDIKNERFLQIGHSLRINFSDNNKLVKITYKNSNMLRVLVKDLDFFLAFIECGEFYLDDSKISFEKESYNLKNFNVARQKERLIYLKKIVLILDNLGFKDDLDIDKLSERDSNNINGLVTGLIDKEPIHCEIPKFSQMIRLTVADVVFGLHIQADEEEPGSYKLYDFFEAEVPQYYINDAGDKVQTSQYAYLSSKDLCELKNLRTSVLLPSFKKYTPENDAWAMATVFLLKLLHAYDLSNGEKTELLNVAFHFAEWAEETACENEERVISQINYFHVLKRSRSLSPEELNELWNMVDDENLDAKNKVEVYLLLGDQSMAKHYFEKLDKDQQEELLQNPIFSTVDFLDCC